MWVYERLSQEEIESVKYGMLSSIPILLGDNAFILHLHCFLTLAETIDVTYLETQVDSTCPSETVALLFGTTRNACGRFNFRNMEKHFGSVVEIEGADEDEIEDEEEFSLIQSVKHKDSRPRGQIR